MERFFRMICMIKITWSHLKTMLAKERRITFSTMLTIARLGAVPFIVFAMIQGAWGWAFGLFLAAAVTDILDGYLARMLHQETFLGACLDALADKILILAVFATLTFVDTPLFRIPGWFLWIVLGKELFQIVGAFIVYTVRGRIYVSPTLLGKVAMMVQTFFIVWLFACYFFGWLPAKTYAVALAVVVSVVLASLVRYLRIGWYQFMRK
jgi:cardiolipin synthase